MTHLRQLALALACALACALAGLAQAGTIISSSPGRVFHSPVAGGPAGLYVTAGSNTARTLPKLFTSADFSTWSEIDLTGLALTGRIVSVATNKAGIWVAVGNIANSGDLHSVALVSTDGGKTWGKVTLPVDTAYFAVRWIQRLGLFVVAGDTDKVVTTPDGTTWANRSPANFGTSGRAIADNGSIAIVKANGTPALSSADAITWSARACNAQTFAGADWNGTRFSSVAGGKVNPTTWTFVETSTNGTSWVLSADGAVPSGSYQALIYTTQFVGVGDVGGITSADGITYTGRTMPSGFWTDVLFDGTAYRAVGTNTNYLSAASSQSTVSADAVSWAGSVALPAGFLCLAAASSFPRSVP